MKASTIHEDERIRYNKYGAGWWDPECPFRPLLLYNKVRIPFLENAVRSIMQRELSTVSILDVGCGGGYLSMALGQQAAKVTGIDISENSIKAAQTEASRTFGPSSPVKFIVSEVTTFAAKQKESFDVVVSSEVIEHVSNPQSFLHGCAQALKPGGVAVLTTPNRTWLSYLVNILGAEYIARILPVGTHQYKQFIKPNELAELGRNVGLEKVDLQGAMYAPWPFGRFIITPFTSILYLMSFKKK